MPIITTKVFEMDRRQLLKLTGTMGVGATFISPQELFAGGLCDQIAVNNGEVDPQQAGTSLQFWIDGLHFDSAHSDLKSRANITLFMDLIQSPAKYVESVVLMDANHQTIGARFFDASMKMADGHVPYVRFENIALDPTKTYYCVYSVKTGTKVTLYQATIDKPSVSRLNTTWLPQSIRNDFTNFLIGNTPNPSPGLLTTQFQFYTLNGLDNHTARGRVTDMASDGSSFKVNIDFMHGDLGADHYMRYFIVMDPVGRILGLQKRDYPGDANKAPAGTTLDVTALTDAQAQTWGIPQQQRANIADCPYIQFFTEDSYDAIARNMIRLR